MKNTKTTTKTIKPKSNLDKATLLLSPEQLKDIEQRVDAITAQVDWGDIYSELPEWKSVMKKLKPLSQGVVANCFFNIVPSKNLNHICFKIFSPTPFEDDSNWEHDLIPELINNLGFSSEYCHCYSDDEMDLTSKNWHSTCAKLFKVLLSLGMTPEDDCFGYEQWLSNQKFENGKPVFDRKERMSLYFWERFEKNKASGKTDEDTHVYTKKIDEQLKLIAKQNVLLNMASAQWRGCKGDIDSLSELVDIAQSISSLESNLKAEGIKDKNSLTKNRKI